MWLEITIFLGAIIMSEIYVCEARYLWWAGGYVADDCSGKGFYCGHFLLCRSYHPPLLSLSLSASPPSHYLWVATTILQKQLFQSLQHQKYRFDDYFCGECAEIISLALNTKLLTGEICLWALQGVRGVHPQRGGWYSGRTWTSSSSSWCSRAARWCWTTTSWRRRPCTARRTSSPSRRRWRSGRTSWSQCRQVSNSFKSTGQLFSFFLQQDILDAWLRCQESWLYLEPIFNSEDIMKQMPVEGRKFNKVNIGWKSHHQDLQ